MDTRVQAHWTGSGAEVEVHEHGGAQEVAGVHSLGAVLESAARAAVADASPELPQVLHRLTALADPTRLALLVAVHAAPGAPVKTLALATGHSANTATQALASLHHRGLVHRRREGRLSRWYLADEATHALLHQVGAPHSEIHPAH